MVEGTSPCALEAPAGFRLLGVLVVPVLKEEEDISFPVAAEEEGVLETLEVARVVAVVDATGFCPGDNDDDDRDNDDDDGVEGVLELVIFTEVVVDDDIFVVDDDSVVVEPGVVVGTTELKD